MLGMGLPMPMRNQSGGGGLVFTTEANALFAAMTTPPTLVRKILINSTIVSLMASGAWALLDVIYGHAAADSQAGRLNWKNPALFTATTVNGPTFTADRGFTGDGATSYLTTGFNPATAGGNYTLNTAYMGRWSLTNSATGSRDIGNANGFIGARSAVASMVSRANNSATQTILVFTDGSGWIDWLRQDSAGYTVERDGVNVSSAVAISSSITSASIEVLRAGGATFSNNQIAFDVVGGGVISAPIRTSIRTSIQTYLQGVGAV